MVAAPGPAAWVELSGTTRVAGAYSATTALTGALGAAAGGRLMDRYGRRPVLVAAHATAALGFAMAGLAFAGGSLLFFVAGTALASSSLGTIFLMRVAAAEIAAPSERARVVARVQVSAAVAAIAGPFVLVPLARLPVDRPDPWLWAIATGGFLLSAWLVSQAKELRGPAGPDALPLVQGAHTRPATGPILAGTTALVCAQAAMVTIMGVTGVHLRHLYGGATTAVVMASHFFGMFALSLVVGRAADRIGRVATIVAGLALLAAGGLTVALLEGAIGLAVGLLVVGLGWSCAYIAGSVLLTDAIAPERRARVVGLVDLATALLTATAAFLGGLWYAQHGIWALGLAAAAVASIPIVLVLYGKATPGRT